jgi:hypothetical protein
MTKRSVLSALFALVLGLILAGTPVGPASAHVGYTQLYADPSVVNPLTGVAGSGSPAFPLASTASSNAGWIAGQDGTTWANSHDNRFFYFNLGRTMDIDFTITGTNTNGNGILNPGYSIFQGTVPVASHDGAVQNDAYLAAQTGFATWSPFAAANAAIDAANGAAPLTTEHWGQYRSNGDVTMSKDAAAPGYPTVQGLVGTMSFTGLSGSNASGNTLSGHYTLGPGLYSLVVGGANPFDLQTYLNAAIATGGNYCTAVSATCTAEQVAAGSANATLYNSLRLARTFDISFSAVPIPAAVYLFGSGLVGIAAFARRRMIA